MPGRRLPPLNSLRAFEAAARHQNLSRAAQELAVTHGAISRQVAKLEEFLDAKLFEHKHQQVILTKKGAAYAARLQVLFDQLQAATLANFDAHPDRGMLRIGVLPTFAMRLLVPRLARFKQRFPDLQLQVDTYTSSRPNDPDVELDIAVWIGNGDWPNLICEPLFFEELVPVGSPGLIAGHTVSAPDDLEQFLLLHALRRPDDWKSWLDLVGATKVDPESGLKLEYSGLVYQGAADGLGVAMAQTMFIHDDVEQGRLVPLFHTPLTTGQAYYLVYSEAAGAQAKVRNFIEWLKGEVAELRQRPALAAQ
ncbi:MAG: transcriptional regulator GcvA [Alphaproteobacteria bacterium]|nr:transcriptional regulator GcvA [Alphaproteobacteria bacterium]